MVEHELQKFDIFESFPSAESRLWKARMKLILSHVHAWDKLVQISSAPEEVAASKEVLRTSRHS